MDEDQKIPVFRKVNGELVRVPDDIRDDQHHLYSRVIDLALKMTYDLELTEEEQKQREIDDAKLKAELPIREEAKRQQEENDAKFRASLVYEDRIVAFIDILGWRNLVDESSNNPEMIQKLGITLNSIQKHEELTQWINVHSGGNDGAGNPRITHFSDTIVLSVTNGRFGQENLYFHLSSLVSVLLMRNMLFRGGITSGSLMHSDTEVYGPALNRAYGLEKKFANYPRVLLDEHLFQLWGVGPCVVNEKDKELLGFIKRWRIDVDGKSFFDFLQPFPNMPGSIVNIDLMTHRMNSVRNLIITNLKKYQTETDILKKYLWFARYFNDILDEYPACETAKIRITVSMLSRLI